MNIIKRAVLPTPKFFQTLRNIGLLLAGVGASLFASPVQLPGEITEIAGYMVLAGGIISAVSQITVDPDLQDGTEKNKDVKTKENERS
jgi:hypothetical protein